MVIAAAKRMTDMRTMIIEPAKSARASPGAGSTVAETSFHGSEIVSGSFHLKRLNVSAAEVDRSTNKT